ncbi:MAG TPA: helix-turn-helix domain-containing protein [Solirubrobacteraceae bacterium]|nr:helix-turn-helix domain-containing protein [Solirubrobacteraceae bacterium]
MSYVERLVASPVVACTWEQASTNEHEQRIVPDACVDLIWAAGGRLTVAGPDTRARVVTLESGSGLVGVRLRPGTAGAILGLPASELRDVSADATEVLGRDVVAALLEELAGGSDPHALLLRAVELRGTELDPFLRAAVVALGRPRARVEPVADELGVSARQLHRRVSDAVGYGPKMLQRVLRFRRLQTLPPAPLVELALDAGYADQAHMTAEVTRLTGVSPVRFLKDRMPTAA